jgi:hypothetical protein
MLINPRCFRGSLQFHQLNLLLPHPLLRLRLPLLPPPRQRRPPIHHISHRPQHTLLIRLLADVVIWTDDVELALPNFLVHVFCDLSARPCAIGLLSGSARDVARLDYCVNLREVNNRAGK